MRAIELCIPSLAYIFGLLLTTHIVQPVQDWALGVEIFGSLLFFPHAVRVLTAWLYGWKSIFLLMPGVILGHYIMLGLPGFTSGAAIGMIAGLVIVPLTFECFKRYGFDFLHQRCKFRNSYPFSLLDPLPAYSTPQFLTGLREDKPSPR